MKFGLIGYPLGHSFSQAWFTDKFRLLGLSGFTYSTFPIAAIDEVGALLHSDLFGLNVTIPYKQSILGYINDIDETAWKIGAVNTLVRTGQYSWKGYNTDVIGFRQSLKNWIGPADMPDRALILGSGGASLAVQYALRTLGIKFKVVSASGHGDLDYSSLTEQLFQSHTLIINTTPLGMTPAEDTCPSIPYAWISPQHWAFDLVYNPANTLFLRRCQQMGARTKGGLDMLHNQADQAWEIWKSYGKF